MISSNSLLKQMVKGRQNARKGSAARAYILLEIREGKSVEAAEVLQSMRGVVMADPLEWPPDVVLVVEASDGQELIRLANRALASIEALIEGLTLLPVQNGLSMATAKKSVVQGTRKETKHA